jgi:hypothetical protein
VQCGEDDVQLGEQLVRRAGWRDPGDRLRAAGAQVHLFAGHRQPVVDRPRGGRLLPQPGELAVRHEPETALAGDADRDRLVAVRCERPDHRKRGGA